MALLDAPAVRAGSVRRTLQILEVVAARGGASAKEIADEIDLPLPTVYRLVRELLDSEYLVHIREEKKFELGYRLHQLALSLHRQIGVPRQVAGEIVGLHQRANAAAYLAIHRGSQIVVVQIVDSPATPRLKPIGFGFHEAAHATALGKILLADMDEPQRERHLDPEPMPRLAPGTLTTRAELRTQLEEVADRGIAWEIEEFQPGAMCCAAAVRNASGSIVGSVAVSGRRDDIAARREQIEHEVRVTASAVSRYYRSGHTS